MRLDQISSLYFVGSREGPCTRNPWTGITGQMNGHLPRVCRERRAPAVRRLAMHSLVRIACIYTCLYHVPMHTRDAHSPHHPCDQPAGWLPRYATGRVGNKSVIARSSKLRMPLVHLMPCLTETRAEPAALASGPILHTTEARATSPRLTWPFDHVWCRVPRTCRPSRS